MKEYLFSVADCCFSVLIPKAWSIARLLPSFHPFLYKGETRPELLFQLKVGEERTTCSVEGGKLLEESTNDLGYVRVMSAPHGYHLEISYDEAREQIHTLDVNRSFTQAVATLIYADYTAGVALSSMLRMLFAQTILQKEGISVHASCVCKSGVGYLFLGKSGTGKSTHSEQWMEVFPDCKLLNDDNPIIRLRNGKPEVYGSPWSGKKNYYLQEHYPVGGIVRLHQAPSNCFEPLADTAAFAAVLPSCSGFRKEIESQQVLYNTLIEIVGMTAIGRLYCLPDNESARLCFLNLVKFQ